MAGIKVKVEFELRDYHLNFIKDQMEKYKIPDEGKAIRILLDYALVDGDLDKIFDRKNMRCISCGSVN